MFQVHQLCLCSDNRACSEVIEKIEVSFVRSDISVTQLTATDHNQKEVYCFNSIRL